jgi:hypothetical protein
VAALSYRPHHRPQHKCGDLIGAVDNGLVGRVRCADVGLVVEIGARQPGLERREWISGSSLSFSR